jgi:Family of unknown function (DUF6476)
MPANDDPRSQPNYRLMKAIVITLGVLMLLAFITLIVGFVMRLTGHRLGAASPAAAVYSLPAHSRIEAMQITASSRIVLDVQTPAGREIDIFDTDTGKLVGQIKVANSR